MRTLTLTRLSIRREADVLRSLVRRVILWAFPEVADAAEYGRLSAHLAADVVDWSHEVRGLRTIMTQQAAYTRELGRLSLAHERQIARLENRDAPGSLSARIARLEMHFMGPLSDGRVELDERLSEELDRLTALGGVGKAEKS